MPIYDWNGSTNTQIGKVYDFNGSVNTQIGRVYDHNGSVNTLIYTADTEIPMSSFSTHPSAARAAVITASSVYVYANISATNSVAYVNLNRESNTKLTVTGYTTGLSGNGEFYIAIRDSRWPFTGTTYAQATGNATFNISSYSSFYLVVWAWSSTGDAGGYLTSAIMT